MEISTPVSASSPRDQNCTGLHILGYGAKIDVKGDFHQSADWRAGSDWYSYSWPVQPVVLLGSENIRIEGLEVYGNVDKMTRGLDPEVKETPGSGIWTGNTCREYTFVDLYVHHFATDGISLGTDEPIADRGAVLLNVRSLYNARNALSILNLRGATFIRCEFSQSGRAAGTYLAHSPAAGLVMGEPGVKADVPTLKGSYFEHSGSPDTRAEVLEIVQNIDAALLQTSGCST